MIAAKEGILLKPFMEDNCGRGQVICLPTAAWKLEKEPDGFVNLFALSCLISNQASIKHKVKREPA